MAGTGGIPRRAIHPSEQFNVSFLYTVDKRPSGSTLVSAVVAAEDLKTGADTSLLVLQSTTGVVSAPDANQTQLVTAQVQGGGVAQDDTRHKVTITSTLSSGEVFVDVFVLVVTDGVTEC